MIEDVALIAVYLCIGLSIALAILAVIWSVVLLANAWVNGYWPFDRDDQASL